MHLTAFVAWDSSLHVLVTPVQLTRLGIAWPKGDMYSRWLCWQILWETGAPEKQYVYLTLRLRVGGKMWRCLNLASFTGSTQLFIACSTEKRWEPDTFSHMSMMSSENFQNEIRYQALSCFSVLQVTQSGNESGLNLHLLYTKRQSATDSGVTLCNII